MIIDSLLVALGFDVDKRALQEFSTKVNKARDAALDFSHVVGTAFSGAFTLIGRSFLNTAAQFEEFETVLGVIEGSSEKGKAAMDWVSKFAAKTPYELAEVTEAFVKLRSYGLDPTTGLLTSLGDTSAAMGKPLMQAVEAIADAMTGQNERLKEFGITAQTQGNKVTYSYVENGKTITATADKTNKAMIQSTLEGIWNRKYAGSMDKLSKSWKGMWSNLLDSVVRFQQRVMESGPFKRLKDGLEDLLEKINAAFDSGAIDDFARTAAWVFDFVARTIEYLWTAIDYVVERTVGWKVAVLAITTVLGSVFVGAILKTAQAVFTITKGMMAFATTSMLPILAIAALGAALVLVIDDFMTFRRGGQSVIGDLLKKWPNAIHVVRGLLIVLGIAFGALAIKGAVAMAAIVVSTVAAAASQVAAWLSVAAATLAATWPLLLIVAIITAVGVAIWALYDNWAEVVAFFEKAADAVGEAIKNAFNGAIDWVIGLFDKAWAKVSAFFDFVSNGAKKIAGAIGIDLGTASEGANAMSTGGDPVLEMISQSPAMTGAQPVANYGPTAKAGPLGNTASMTRVDNSMTNSGNTHVAKIEIVSTDPAKAGESVKRELDRTNKTGIRNGQAGYL